MAVVHFHNRHTSKNQTVKECSKFHIDYAKNLEKTQNGLLVSAYECSPETAAEEFLISQKMYKRITKRSQPKDKDNISYMLMQSFKPEEITPQKAHEIGYQFAYEFTKGQHQFVVSTHIDKDHIHNHVEINSTSLDCTHKFNSYKQWGKAAQKLSDKICKEYGLSTIKQPQQKGKPYAEWKEKKKDGKGAGYEQWAKIFNVKQAANTVNFLTENEVDYQQLKQQVQNSTEQFHHLSDQLKQKEKQIKEVLELKTNIIYYVRTIDIYKQYQKTKDKQNFKKEHNGDIIKHEKAKTFFEKTNQKKIARSERITKNYSNNSKIY